MRRIVKSIATKLLVSSNTTRIRTGILRGYRLPHSIASVNLAMVLGKYEVGIQRVLHQQSKAGEVAYDIGAHVGFFTLLLSHGVGIKGRVVAFEPSAVIAGRIEELLLCNGLLERVSLERSAVCDEVGEVTFHTGAASFTGILNKVSKEHHRNEGTSVKVQAVTLDEFVFVRNNPAPDLIKIDVESAEASVIRGASRLLSEKRPRMLVEVHGPNACRDTIAEILLHEYRIDLLTPEGTVPVTMPDQLRERFWKGKWTNHILALPR